MKKLTTAILGNAFVFLLLSCGSVDLSKKYPHMVANVDPFSAGVVEGQFDRFFSSKVNKAEIEAVFHPRLNAVSLEFRYEMVKYRQFWDEAARKQFASSLELYKRDYEDRKLLDKYRKTRSAYGKTKSRLEWEAFKFTKTRISYPTIEIGYRFKEKTPFFTILMRSAKEEMANGDSSNPMDSQQINMYFTRAQADELVKIFDQAYLIGLLAEKTNAVIDGPAAAPDAAPAAPATEGYREYGE
jgi:competence CoiA-like predicted nuclease